MRAPILSHSCASFLPPSPRGDTDLSKGRTNFRPSPSHMDMKRSNTPPAANLVPKVASSGDTCSVPFPDMMNSARQLYSASNSNFLSISVHNSIIQMVLLVLKILCDTFACVKSMVPDYVLRESECVSGKPCSESPIARTVSEFNSWKRIRRSNELTKNESQHHSDPGSYGKTSSPTWVVSSAVPHHVTGNCALLSGLVTKHGDTFVHAVDELPMPVVGHGAAVSDEVEIPDVWLVPGLSANLVSICQLVAMGYSVEFGSGMCFVRNTSDGTIVGEARLRKGGQYVLDFLKVPLVGVQV